MYRLHLHTYLAVTDVPRCLPACLPKRPVPGHVMFAQPVPRMRDIVYEMEVTLEELCRGGCKKIRIWGNDNSGGSGGSGERVAKDIEIELRSNMHSVGVWLAAANVDMGPKSGQSLVDRTRFVYKPLLVVVLWSLLFLPLVITPNFGTWAGSRALASCWRGAWSRWRKGSSRET